MALVGVLWSVCSPSTLTIRVRILLKNTAFFCKMLLEKNGNDKKEIGLLHLKKILYRRPKLLAAILT